MAQLLSSIFKFVLIILIAYTAFSLIFSNRVTTPYFSVILSDGWALSKPINIEQDKISGSFINKRTKTVVNLRIQNNGISAELENFSDALSSLSDQLLDSNRTQSSFKNANGYTYSNFKDANGTGIILKTKNNNMQATIQIYGPEHGDGVDFVNTFFEKDESLFPHFVDPTVPENSFNYVLILRTLKTWVHEYLSPAAWFN